MFSVDARDSIREQLLAAADRDPAVVGAAVTGSHAVEGADRWSDIDLVLGIEGALDSALHQWSDLLYRDFAAVHHWDLPSGSSVYRVFLLPGMLEVDIGFTPAAQFGPRGPGWVGTTPCTHGSVSNATAGGRPSSGSAPSAARFSPWPACASVIPPATRKATTCFLRT